MARRPAKQRDGAGATPNGGATTGHEAELWAMADALREIRERFPQDLIRPLQLTDLALQLLQPLPLARRQARPMPSITLRLPHPLPQRLRRAAELRRHRLQHRPL